VRQITNIYRNPTGESLLALDIHGYIGLAASRDRNLSQLSPDCQFRWRRNRHDVQPVLSPDLAFDLPLVDGSYSFDSQRKASLRVRVRSQEHYCRYLSGSYCRSACTKTTREVKDVDPDVSIEIIQTSRSYGNRSLPANRDVRVFRIDVQKKIGFRFVNRQAISKPFTRLSPCVTNRNDILAVRRSYES